MKNMMLFIGIVAMIIVSCAKTDDDTTSSTGTSSTAADTTASGSMTVGSESLLGTYVTSCDTTWIALMIALETAPSDTKAINSALLVTGDTAFSQETYLYSDTSCSMKTMTTKQGKTSVVIGDASGSDFKVTFANSTITLSPGNSTAETFFEALYEKPGVTVDLTAGMDTTYGAGDGTYKNLINVTSTTFKMGTENTNDYPSSVNTTVYTKQ